MAGSFISADGGAYYVGDQRNPLDQPCQMRPDDTYLPDGSGGWVPSAATRNAPILAKINEILASIAPAQWLAAGADDAGGTAVGRARMKGLADQIKALEAQLQR